MFFLDFDLQNLGIKLHKIKNLKVKTYYTNGRSRKQVNA